MEPNGAPDPILNEMQVHVAEALAEIPDEKPAASPPPPVPAAPSFIPPPAPAPTPAPQPKPETVVIRPKEPEITFNPPLVVLLPPTPPTPPPAPAPQPQPATQPAQPTPPKVPSPLKQIRTFQGDMAEALKGKNASVYAIQQAEQKRTEARKVLAPNLKPGTPTYTPPLPPKPTMTKGPLPQVEAPARRMGSQAVEVEEVTEPNARIKILLLLLGTIILLGAGGYGAWYAYNLYLDKTASPMITEPENRFLTIDSSLSLDASVLDRDGILNALTVEKSSRHFTGIEQIEIRTKTATSSSMLATANFLDLINSHAPKALVRAFDPHFMLGILGGTPTHTFLLVKLSSFENAFPGMLAWERNLSDDLLPFISNGADASSTPSGIWSDITIQNQDARVLKDQAGRTVLLYSFFNNAMLVVTDNETALRELIGRLTTESLSR